MNSPTLEMSSWAVSRLLARSSETYVREVDHLVAVNSLCNLVDSVSDLFRGRSTVVTVELDAKVIVRPTRVVRRRKEDTAVGLF